MLTNGLMSSLFNFTRGSMRGDTLSPLLFVLFLEPLATVRLDTDINRVWCGGCEHKLFLYADDILLLSSDPVNSLPLVLNMIKSFSENLWVQD